MRRAASSTGGYSSGMPAGTRHVVSAAVVLVFIALAIPTVAVAGNTGKCNASACKVYVEPNGPSAGGGQNAQQPQGTRPKSTTHHSTKLTRGLARAGNDRGPLKHLLVGPAVGSLKGGNVASPSMLGAVSDLGAGPLALLSILLATALGLAARGSVRSWLHRRSSD
jgi:hypothetical protein